MKRCKHIKGSYECGSYAFNLHADNIDQGDLCDVHYWQDKFENNFKPDYDTEATLVEEMQRMAKRIEELETEQDCVGWFGYDTGLRLWFEADKGDDGAIPLYKARSI